MKSVALVLVSVLVSGMLQGCASTAQLEARQLAYNGQGPDPCAWGGVSEAANAHCVEVHSGLLAYLRVVNEAATRNLPTAADATPCQDHVARLETMLADRKDLKTSPLYSCPKSMHDCHLSLMVTDATGHHYVLDNGALFPRNRMPGSVGDFDQFAQLAGKYHVVAKASEVSMPEELPESASESATESVPESAGESAPEHLPVPAAAATETAMP